MIGRHTVAGGEDTKGRILIVDDDRDFADSLVAVSGRAKRFSRTFGEG